MKGKNGDISGVKTGRLTVKKWKVLTRIVECGRAYHNGRS